jgi:hypothetical protein
MKHYGGARTRGRGRFSLELTTMTIKHRVDLKWKSGNLPSRWFSDPSPRHHYEIFHVYLEDATTPVFTLWHLRKRRGRAIWGRDLGAAETFVEAKWRAQADYNSIEDEQ